MCGWNDRLKIVQTLSKEFNCYPFSKGFFMSENIRNGKHNNAPDDILQIHRAWKIVCNKKRDGGVNLVMQLYFP